LTFRSELDCANAKTKDYALLNEFLTEAIPEIDVAIKDFGAADEVEIEVVIDETTPSRRILLRIAC
jgi:hypothetical protein